MSVFRIEKTNNYTVMSNYHLREREMSLKAKGLLSLMLSLPNDWDYTIEGLVAICKENATAVKSTLKELKGFGYLKILKVQNQKGQFEYEYNIYEKPQRKKPEVENLEVENPSVENQGQLNTNKQNTKKINTNNIKEKINKKKFGEFGNVKLTNDEYDKVKQMFPNDYDKRIQILDDYIQSKGKKYKDFVATLRNWARKDGYIFPEEKKQKKELLVIDRMLSDEEWSRYYNNEMTEDEFKKIVEERQWMIES